MEIIWDGPLFGPHRLPRMNRDLVLALMRTGNEVWAHNTGYPPQEGECGTDVARILSHLSGGRPADVLARQDWPPRLGDRWAPLYLWLPPLPGVVPATWAPALLTHTARIVVPWTASGRILEAAGIPENHLWRIPPGVDPGIFHPWGDVADLNGAPEHVLLFVADSATSMSGLDRFLDAYAEAFSAEEPVLAVVKTGGLGRGEPELKTRLSAWSSHPGRPPLLWIDESWEEARMAALYRRATLLVAPYRHEVLGLHLLEAMASGCLVLASAAGPALEFLSPAIGVPLPGERNPVPDSPTPQEDFSCNIEALRDLLRHWTAAPAARRRALGSAASRMVRARFTWDHAARRFVAALEAERGGQDYPPVHVRPRNVSHAFEGEIPVLEARRQRWVHLFRSGERVLDLGTGEGFFLSQLLAAGIEAIGIEADPERVTRAQDRGLDVRPGLVPDCLHPDAGALEPPFDGITVFHLIEHLEPDDAAAMVRNAARLLAPGGRLVLLTPRIAHPLVVESFWIDVSHRRPYPPLLLQELCRQAGLAVVDSGQLEEGQEVYVIAVKPGQRTAEAASDASPALFIGWRGPVRNVSGYASEARDFLKALPALGIIPRIFDETGVLGWALTDTEARYFDSLEQLSLPRKAPMVQEVPAGEFFRWSGPNIGRTMFETDRIPEDWVTKCRLMDAVCVPTTFNIDTFHASGVPMNILHVVPGIVDTTRFHPMEGPKPARDRYRFIAVFDWTVRKGWDILIRAWARAFTARDAVELILKVNRVVDSRVEPERLLAGTVTRAGLKWEDTALVTVDSTDWPADQLARWYREADAFVLPTRGEGWGRPILEAMASGLPVIATAWSAPATYLTPENSVPLPSRGLVPVPPDFPLPIYHGHRWANPDEDYLVDALRWCVNHQGEASTLGRNAVATAGRFTAKAAATRLGEIIRGLVSEER